MINQLKKSYVKNGSKRNFLYQTKNREKNYEKPLIDKKCDYFLMNNEKYHQISITKPNALLVKALFLSMHERHRFCLNCFCKA